MLQNVVVDALIIVTALLALAAIGANVSRKSWANTVVYGVSAVLCAAGLTCGIAGLISLTPATASLPLGLPWIGMHFRIDALSAVFVAVVNLGGVAASVFGLGYGRHESAPQRILPFYPAFLAAMNLVVIADDAFTFLLSWELMSLMSWALVVGHDRTAENLRAGYVYILMASIGTLTLLLAFAIMAGAGGHYAFDSMRAHGRWRFAPMGSCPQPPSPQRPRSFMSSITRCSRAFCFSAPARCKSRPASATWIISAA
jgi:formate hydrogenlyase subunit 3/multisubunit Na+/H+ antiporter MnhD subunit